MEQRNHVKEIGWLAKEKRYKTCGWWKLKWPWAQCSEYGLQAFGNQQKECSEAQMCKLQSDILTADTYKFQKKSCEDQFQGQQEDERDTQASRILFGFFQMTSPFTLNRELVKV
ncbi:Hypothetical predicted protein [Mytilus galloprovincialis]|uniref:Uncharacterized protein n=1 Tax=Mytilus galloprovincialis TaxID=29158 RepID=A0A8B6BN96_MYTGA|nr:Hypothetical predicted protein [Mytilus galloprovincialis]